MYWVFFAKCSSGLHINVTLGCVLFPEWIWFKIQNSLKVVQIIWFISWLIDLYKLFTVFVSCLEFLLQTPPEHHSCRSHCEIHWWTYKKDIQHRLEMLWLDKTTWLVEGWEAGWFDKDGRMDDGIDGRMGWLMGELIRMEGWWMAGWRLNGCSSNLRNASETDANLLFSG